MKMSLAFKKFREKRLSSLVLKPFISLNFLRKNGVSKFPQFLYCVKVDIYRHLHKVLERRTLLVTHLPDLSNLIETLSKSSVKKGSSNPASSDLFDFENVVK